MTHLPHSDFSTIARVMVGGVIWIPVALAPVAAFYVIGPAIIRFQFKYRVLVEHILVKEEDLEPEVRCGFINIARSLEALGFSSVTLFEVHGAVGHVDSHLWIWTHYERGQYAACMCVTCTSNGRATNNIYVEFTTLVSPLQMIDTTDGSTPGVFDRMDWHNVRRFPWISDVKELYQVHLWREKNLVPDDSARVIVPAESIDKMLQEAELYTMRCQVKRGSFLEQEEGVFTYTWYGAYLTCLRMLPPVRQVRRMMLSAEARREHRLAAADPALPSENPFSRKLD